MQSITIVAGCIRRHVVLLLATALLALGVVAVSPPATAQAGTIITLCNSPSSGPAPYDAFQIYDNKGTSTTGDDIAWWVDPGVCKSLTNTTTLRVRKFGYPSDQAWRVREVPGTYGSCHWGESNPGSGDKYSYLVGYDPTGC